MRKVIATVILIGIVVGFAFYINSVIEKNKKQVELGNEVISEENIVDLLKKDYDAFVMEIREFQEYPDQLVKLNCMITKILYSEKLDEDTLELVIKAQREYFHLEALENNPEDVNTFRIKDEIDKWKALGLKIIGYDMVGPKYLDTDESQDPMVMFDVVYYLNTSAEEGDIYMTYIFQENENKLWQLKGFGEIPKFEIIP